MDLSTTVLTRMKCLPFVRLTFGCLCISNGICMVKQQVFLSPWNHLLDLPTNWYLPILFFQLLTSILSIVIRHFLLSLKSFVPAWNRVLLRNCIQLVKEYVDIVVAGHEFERITFVAHNIFYSLSFSLYLRRCAIGSFLMNCQILLFFEFLVAILTNERPQLL